MFEFIRIVDYVLTAINYKIINKILSFYEYRNKYTVVIVDDHEAHESLTTYVISFYLLFTYFDLIILSRE